MLTLIDLQQPAAPSGQSNTLIERPSSSRCPIHAKLSPNLPMRVNNEVLRTTYDAGVTTVAATSTLFIAGNAWADPVATIDGSPR
jgi:hypothetical protein